MTPEGELNRELDELCYRAALDVLAEKLDPAVGSFAVETIRASRGESMTENRPESEALSELTRLAAMSEEQRAVEFVGDFCVKLFEHPTCARSNSRKVRDYNILCSAACELSISGEEGEDEEAEKEMWDKFSLALITADPTEPMWGQDKTHDMRDYEFQALVMSAFRSVIRQPGFSFSKLAAEIRNQQNKEELRQLRRKLGLKPCARSNWPDWAKVKVRIRGKRSSAEDMSEKDEQFYR